MIALEEARARVLAGCPRLHPRAVPLDEALGCVTSVDLTAEEAVPPFDNTAMDGYAVRAADTADPPVRLRVVGTLAAGAGAGGMAVGPGEAVRIMTGAVVPAGADAVVMVERTSLEPPGAPSGPEVVVVEASPRPGDNVRRAGEDLRPGQEVFPAFTRLGPGHLGVLASLGMARVPVFPRARVGVLSTGDELDDGPGELRPGQIRDSNRHALLAQLREAGAEALDLGVVGDDEKDLEEALRRGLSGCDAVVTSGGVSMGDFDVVKALLDRLAPDRMSWMQVAVKPAKPLSFGVVEGKPVFGLPGNPVSSMVSFELFARPGLLQMMGHAHLDRLHVKAVADQALRRRADGKLHLVRAVASWSDDDRRFHVRSSGGQGSNLLRAMALANALVLLPDGEGVEQGGWVTVMLLGAGEPAGAATSAAR